MTGIQSDQLRSCQIRMLCTNDTNEIDLFPLYKLWKNNLTNLTISNQEMQTSATACDSPGRRLTLALRPDAEATNLQLVALLILG